MRRKSQISVIKPGQILRQNRMFERVIPVEQGSDWLQCDRPLHNAGGRHLAATFGLERSEGRVNKVCQITANLRRAHPVLILENGASILTMVARAARWRGHRIRQNVQHRNRPDSQTFRDSIRAAYYPEYERLPPWLRSSRRRR
jgi:hypothetical protein